MTRLTVGPIKRLKLEKGIDLAEQKWPEGFYEDPFVVSEVTYLLYEDQITRAGLTRDDFENSLEPEDVGKLREEVGEKMSGFFGSWKTAYMQDAVSLFGDSDVMSQIVGKAMDRQVGDDRLVAKEASGLSS